MENREIIIFSALRLFSLQGYDGTGIQEVATSSGIGKPTIYYYFGNKEGLLKAIIDYYFDDFYLMLSRAAEYEHDLSKTLFRITDAVFSFASGNTLFYRMFLSMGFDPPQSTSYNIVIPYHEKEFSLIEKLFLLASVDHGNMKGREAQYAVSFMGIINTYITLFIQKKITHEQTSVRSVVHQFMHGIFS